MSAIKGELEWRVLFTLSGPYPERVSELDCSALDWDWLISLACRHKSFLLFHRGLEQQNHVHCPPEHSERMANVLQKRTTLALNLTRESILIFRALTDAGIKATVLKGAPLSQQIHGEASLRDPGDVDILVQPEDIVRSAGVLSDLGFSTRYASILQSKLKTSRLVETSNQLAFYRASDGTCIELQWSWHKSAYVMPTDASRIWDAEKIELGGQHISIPDANENFIYLCAHGTTHLWYRLKWLNDIRWLLSGRASTQPDFLEIIERANAIQMTTTLLTAVDLVCRLDGLPCPEPFKKPTKFDQRSRILSRLSEDWMRETMFEKIDPKLTGWFEVIRDKFRKLHVATANQPLPFFIKLKRFLSPDPRDIQAIYLPKGFGAGYILVKLYWALSKPFRKSST